MCNRFIEDFTNKVVEKAFKKTWFWVYSSQHFPITTHYLFIGANSRNEAIWKIKLAADVHIDKMKSWNNHFAGMHDAYGINLLFRPDKFDGPFNNYNLDKVAMEVFIPAFEKQLQKYKEYGYELKEITETDKI